jgi:hypothetical protein
LQKQLKGGWIAQAGYVGSRQTPQVQAQQYFALNRALMPYDRTHNFNTSFSVELPLGKSALARGWQVNGIFSACSGAPFTVTASGTSLNAPGNTQRADQVKPTVAIPGGVGPGQSYFDPLAYAPVTAVRFGTSGYDSLRGPGLVNLDFSLFRDFRITERFKAQFRAEALNFTNTPHFSNPASNVSNLQLNPDGSVKNLGGFSVITTTTGTGREGVDERVFRFGLRLNS